MTEQQADAMELASSRRGGQPWNWSPMLDWEIQPNITYTWADPLNGDIGSCVRKRARTGLAWESPPKSEAVVLRHRHRSRPRDQIGYLLRRMFPHWEVTVGTVGHDFVELQLRALPIMVLIRGREVLFFRRVPTPDSPDLCRTICRHAPFTGRAWVVRLVLAVYTGITRSPVVSE